MAVVPSYDRTSATSVPITRPRFARLQVGPALRYVVLLALAVIFLVPFYIMLRNALMTQPEITSFEWSWWSKDPQWANVKKLFTENEGASMGKGLRNSAIIATLNLVFQTLFASMAGYALARIPFRGKDIVFFIILSTLMIPSAVIFVPSYVFIAKLHGVNTLWGIVVPGLFNAFATFLFRQFYLDFPTEIEDAGRVDGLGYWGIYWRLLLPNSRTIMAALGVLSFIYSWNAFLWPAVIGQDDNSYTVQVVISTYLTAQTINLPMLFMGAVVGCAPLVIVFLVMQRFIVQGVRLSGIKG